MATPRSGFIPEIQGLRTIALLLVATFHIWFDRVSGGVDVFLLVSAYLLTRSLTARAERGVRTRPVEFLVNKFARLLPAAATTIALVVLAGLVLMPLAMRSGLLGDSLAALLYGENFRLQAAQVDYFQEAGSVASPLQHFWSLAIQGQVFVLWAVLHLLGELAARACGRDLRAVLAVGFGAIFAGSLAYSVWLTDANQTLAYFDTGARLWEFAAGSLLALAHPLLRLPARLRAGMSWLGLAGILTGGVLLPVESSFPGYIALWPVLSAALVILGAGTGTADSRPAGAGRLLARPLLTTIGGYTYALYLVHWPVLVFYLLASGASRPGPVAGTLLLLLSGVLSVLVHHLVERPVSAFLARRREREPAPDGRLKPARRPVSSRPASSRPATRPALAVGAFLAAGVVLVGSAGLVTEQRLREAEENAVAIDYAALGANSAETLDFDPGQEHAAAGDWTRPGNDCAPDDPYASHRCFLFPVAEGEEVERDILLVGSSHANQLAGTLLETVARQPDWSMRTYFAADCHYAYSQQADATEECIGTWEAASRYVVEQQPDLVIVIGTHSEAAGDIPAEGLDLWLQDMQSHSPDSQFVAVRDNPRFEDSMFECGQLRGFDDIGCLRPYPGGEIDEWREHLESLDVTWADLNGGICTEGVCAPIRGGLFTYMDTNHLTDSFTRSLSQLLADQLVERIEWWPVDAYAGEYDDRIIRDQT
ncbi:acyltransferase family protein [Gulosibacter sp. 10]|uniref:acyltransferase family protein n=1 Tax=Gulosibacter sp. 10 TaxID=1255570 RepID=UPI00097EC428|nr:acyltransferase family protein [Gulosibacter sp. 10]SJM66184.1 acyltransferase 3 [Gulosibacter sp. 10]